MKPDPESFLRRTSRPVDFATGLQSDHTVGLATAKSRRAYPAPLRRVRYVDPTTTKRLTFLTNNFTLPALAITQLYKSRWAVEPRSKQRSEWAEIAER